MSTPTRSTGQYSSQALVPNLISQSNHILAVNLLSVMAGSLLLAALAQVSVPLPFTPVPITGQTFGVALLALTWGSRRAMAAFALYLVEGFVGLPFFAMGASGFSVGPTLGYLLGMFVACGVVGHLADRGHSKKLSSAFLSCVLGSALIFSVGLFGLSFFVPKESLLSLGLLPFLPGDVIKNFLAAYMVSRLSKKFSA